MIVVILDFTVQYNCILDFCFCEISLLKVCVSKWTFKAEHLDSYH